MAESKSFIQMRQSLKYASCCLHSSESYNTQSKCWLGILGVWFDLCLFGCLGFFYFKVVLCINISGNFYELLNFSIHLISMAENSS